MLLRVPSVPEKFTPYSLEAFGPASTRESHPVVCALEKIPQKRQSAGVILSGRAGGVYCQLPHFCPVLGKMCLRRL